LVLVGARETRANKESREQMPATNQSHLRSEKSVTGYAQHGKNATQY
jgi:hypothetical protein